VSLLKSVLIKTSGNRFIQNLLAKNVQASQYWMGIGSGSSVLSSGEQAIFHVLLKQRQKLPYCIFDVGANKGQFLQLILEKVTVDNCSIHCFEPGQEAFQNLINDFNKDIQIDRIKLNNIGIGRESCEAVLHYDHTGSGLASLTQRKLDHFGIHFNKSEKVGIDTIDNYCSSNGIDHIHLLKIDIEGHELDALAGAKKMFAEKAIDIVTFEFGGCNIDTRTFFQDFWYFFNELDFRIFRITPSGYFHPIKLYQEIHEQFQTINFIAISKGTSFSHEIRNQIQD
jgi:FkbM family methyltransferase